MHLVHYSMKRMQENEALIGCHKVTIPPTANLNKVRSAIAQAASEEDSSAEKSSTTNGGTPNHNKPVAATELIASRSFSTNSKPTTIFNDKNSAVFAEGNALVNTIAPNKLELVKGSLVARCSKTLEIDAIGAHVTLSKGCVALVKADEHFLKVTNLSDLENDSIKVAVGDKSISILPARELVLSDRAPSLSQVFDVHQIGHRTIVSRQMSEKIWATDSEVALPDELKYQPLVSWIRTEHVNAGQPLVNQVLKTAAVLQIIRNPGQYVRGEIDDEVETTAMIAHGCSSCTH